MPPTFARWNSTVAMFALILNDPPLTAKSPVSQLWTSTEGQESTTKGEKFVIIIILTTVARFPVANVRAGGSMEDKRAL